MHRKTAIKIDQFQAEQHFDGRKLKKYQITNTFEQNNGRAEKL